MLRRLEETGRVRRGYFVAGLGAAQFAQPGAVDLLRAAREDPETPLAVTLAATDPANPYGALLPWPDCAGPPAEPTAAAVRAVPIGRRARGSRRRPPDRVDRARRSRACCVSLPADEPDRSRVGRALAQELVALAHRAPEGSRGWLIEEINGVPGRIRIPLPPFLLDAGFAPTAMGLQLRVARSYKSQR